MKSYDVTVTYRPHFNSLKTESVNYYIKARNKQAAVFRAGWMMHLEGRSHVPDSVVIKVVGL